MKGFCRDLIAGLRLFAPGTILGTLIVLVGTAAFAGGIYNTLEYAFVRDVLHVDGAGFGFMMSALGLGALLAVPLVAGPLKAVAPPRLIVAGLGMTSLSVFALALSAHVWTGVASLFLFGLSNMIMYLPVLTLFALAAEPSMRGRVYGTASSLGALFAASAALAAAGLVLVFHDLRILFACLGAVFALSALFAQHQLGRQRPGLDADSAL